MLARRAPTHDGADLWLVNTKSPTTTRPLMIMALVLMPTLAWAEAKVALVIGNDAYESVPKLQKAANDARALEQALTELGFTVIPAIDVTTSPGL